MISLILLSGGKGKRTGLPHPKQYSKIKGSPLVLHSLAPFLKVKEISEIIIVCEEKHQTVFESYSHVKFALPGNERCDSVKNGFKALDPLSEEVLIHDGARPFVKPNDILNLIIAGRRTGAAALGTKASSTIKEAKGKFVKKTLKRENLWIIHTPQYLKKDLLRQGILEANRQGIDVTDDVAFAELVDHPVELVESCPSNLKVTTSFDLDIVNQRVQSEV